MRCFKKVVFTLGIFFVFFLVSCADFFQPKVPMDDSNGKYVTLSDIIAKKPEVKELDAPRDIKVSQNLYSDTISVSWSTVKNALSYYVYRAALDPDVDGNYDTELIGGNSYKFLDNVFDTVYDDKVISDYSSSLTNPSEYYATEYNRRYFYKVVARNDIFGLKPSDPIESFSFGNDGEHCSYGTFLPYVKTLNASMDSSTEIKISWDEDKLENASKYIIYRSEKADGMNSTRIADTVRKSYSDKMKTEDQGKEYFYQVVANVGGKETIKSPIARGMCLKKGAPNPPQDVYVSDGVGTSTNEIKVEWSPVTYGLPDALENVNGITYKVTRTQSTDNYVKSTTIADNVKTTSFIDSNVEQGIIYRYAIQTKQTGVYDDDKGQETYVSSPNKPSFLDDKETRAKADGFLLCPPTSISVEDGTDSDHKRIKFKQALGFTYTENYTYEIYEGTEKDGNYTNSVAVNVSNTEGSDGFVWCDVPKKPFYSVKTINSIPGKDPVKSVESEHVAPQPDAPRDVTASKTSNLDGTIQNYKPNANGVYPVKITWKRPLNDHPYAYMVKRSSKIAKGYQEIMSQDEIVIPTPTQDTDADYVYEYIDKNETAYPRDLYYYKVFSLNVFEAGNKSNEVKNYGVDAGATGINYQDNPACGYGALELDTWFREYNNFINKHVKLMFKKSDTDKLGHEEPAANIHGTLEYTAKLDGLGARIVMQYKNYCDEYVIKNDPLSGDYFVLNGFTNTSANMSSNGDMDGTVQITGMYPATCGYDHLKVKGGDAGGGYYAVTSYNVKGNQSKTEANKVLYKNVDWSVSKK